MEIFPLQGPPPHTSTHLPPNTLNSIHHHHPHYHHHLSVSKLTYQPFLGDILSF